MYPLGYSTEIILCTHTNGSMLVVGMSTKLVIHFNTGGNIAPICTKITGYMHIDTVSILVLVLAPTRYVDIPGYNSQVLNCYISHSD